MEYQNSQAEIEEGYPTLEISYENYPKFVDKVAECHVDNILQELYSHDIIKDMKYLSLYQPKYYNYETDSIEMQVDFNARQLEKYCFKDNFFKFSEYLKNNFTSYDGFMSFVPNTINGIKELKLTENGKYWQVLIEFYMMQEIDFENVHERTWEDENELFWSMSTKVEDDVA